MPKAINIKTETDDTGRLIAKECTKCHEVKSLDDYYWIGARKREMTQCKNCFNSVARARYIRENGVKPTMYQDDVSKECSTCREIRSLDMFAWSDKQAGKRTSVCKDCESKRQHTVYETNKAKMRAHITTRSKTPAQRYQAMLVSAKRRAIECDMPFDEYSGLIETECHYCDGAFCKRDDCVGCFIDRADNSKGYVSGNCIPCCKVCNTIKSRYLSKEEMEVAVKAILDYRAAQGIKG